MHNGALGPGIYCWWHTHEKKLCKKWTTKHFILLASIISLRQSQDTNLCFTIFTCLLDHLQYLMYWSNASKCQTDLPQILYKVAGSSTVIDLWGSKNLVKHSGSFMIISGWPIRWFFYHWHHFTTSRANMWTTFTTSLALGICQSIVDLLTLGFCNIYCS